MQKLLYQGPLAYFLLRHLNRASRDEGVLRFNFNGVEACFGPKEYLAITGLSFGPSKELPSRSNLRDATFGSHRRIYTRDIEKKLKEICSRRSGERITLKLALALFVFGVLIGPSFVDHAIDINYLHIFDDIDAVNSFPWGRVSYDIMISGFYESCLKLDEQAAASKRLSVDINGFALALQVWAYEVFPEIARLRSYKIHEQNIPFPRILRWLSPHKFRYRLFEQQIVSALPLQKVPFIFTTEEEAEIQRTLLDNPDFGTHVGQEHLSCPIDVVACPVKRKLPFTLKDEDFLSEGEGCLEAYLGEGSSMFDLNLTIPSSSTELSDSARTTSLENYVPSVGGLTCIEANATPSSKSPDLFDLCTSPNELHFTSHDSMEFNVFGSPCTEASQMFGLHIVGEMCNGDTDWKESYNILGGSGTDFASEWINDISPLVDHMIEGKGRVDAYTASTKASKTEPYLFPCDEVQDSLMTREPKGQVDVHIGSNEVAKHEPLSTSSIQVEDSTKNSEAKGQLDDDNAHSKVGKAELQSTSHATVQYSSEAVMYNPMKRYPREELDKFLNWYDSVEDNQKFKIPLQSMQEVSRVWIGSINTMGKKLGDEHCDVLLNLLLFKARVKPRMFQPMWTCVEALFWAKSVFSSFEDASTLMMRYVMGELPLEGALPWCHAVEVFGIAHLFTDHWVAYEIDLLSQKIYVYDSLSEYNDWEKVKEQFVQLSEFVPRLLQQARVFAPAQFNEVSLDAWPVVPSTVTPKTQTRLNDCGILAIKYLECLASGANVGSVDPNNTENYRRYFCAQLFNGGLAAGDVLKRCNL